MSPPDDVPIKVDDNIMVLLVSEKKKGKKAATSDGDGGTIDSMSMCSNLLPTGLLVVAVRQRRAQPVCRMESFG